jgi:hypothetical protein
MFESKDIYFDESVLSLTFPSLNARWNFYGSDSKSYRGQSDIVYLVCDELTEFDDSENWRATIDTFAIKNKGSVCFLITTPGYKLDSAAYKLFQETDDTRYNAKQKIDRAYEIF